MLDKRRNHGAEGSGMSEDQVTRERRSVYNGFVRYSVYGIVVIIVILAGMALFLL